MKNRLLIALCLTSPMHLLFGAELGLESGTADFGGLLESGFYGAAGTFTGDVPDTAHSWSHLITSRHSNPANNHQLQIAASYAVNDRLFFRKIATNGAVSYNPPWFEVATRGGNTFSGNQTLNGTFQLQRVGSPSYPNGLVQNSQSLHMYVGDGAAWFISEQDENTGSHGSVNFVIDDDGSAVPSFNIYGKSNFSLPALRVLSDGRVGIGMPNPTHALEVNGTIRTKEVIVETANWPDYVFGEDYALAPLHDVGVFISENGRLPGMPSAKYVAENGVAVSEVQRLLTEKVEELTLYAIEKDRQLMELNERLAKLEALVLTTE